MYTYKGKISTTIKNNVFKDLKFLLDSNKASTYINRKVLFTVDELLTNIVDYYSANKIDKEIYFSYEKDESLNKEKLIFESKIKNDDIKNLQRILDQLIETSIEELVPKIEALITSSDPINNNAGIGLMLIKKKYNPAITCVFNKSDDFTSDFVLTLIHKSD